METALSLAYRYLQSGKAKIIGLPPRNVPVLTRSGEQRLCSLKVNKMTVGGGQGVPYFIGKQDYRTLISHLEMLPVY